MPSPILAQVLISTVSIASSLGIGIKKKRQLPESKPAWDLGPVWNRVRAAYPRKTQKNPAKRLV